MTASLTYEVVSDKSKTNSTYFQPYETEFCGKTKAGYHEGKCLTSRTNFRNSHARVAVIQCTRARGHAFLAGLCDVNRCAL